MKVVFLGATRGMGRALSRRMAERGDELFLLGRKESDLSTSAKDLEIRSGGDASVGFHLCDLEDPSTFEAALDKAEETLSGLDAVVVTGGLFGKQEDLEQDLPLTRRILNVNFTNTILFCEHSKQRLLRRGGGTLCVFSSVAGDRGRKPVALYGASKAGLSHYLESLDHKHRADGLVTICVKPGFVKTGMTEGVDPPPFAGEPDPVAMRVLSAIDRGAPMVYAPAVWGHVMRIIRFLPRFVMRRVGF